MVKSALLYVFDLHGLHQTLQDRVQCVCEVIVNMYQTGKLFEIQQLVSFTKRDQDSQAKDGHYHRPKNSRVLWVGLLIDYWAEL